MQKYGGWEIIEPLGEGGQSEVHLVRSPARVIKREKCLQDIRTALDGDKRAELAVAICSYARADSASELGALKVFKISPKGSTLPPPPGSVDHEAIERFKNEIKVLTQNRPGLPKLLDSNEDERWIVTEFFFERTLEHHSSKYRGKAVTALRAFRSLVATVASLHKDHYVHRDIKPANVFVRKDDEIVLGDFGIVYMPSVDERLTVTNERVGPRDYMPPWGDRGERLEKVEPNFDVYMLGKLLWCMIAGRLKLQREYHRRKEFDLELLFPNNEHMHLINSILDRCVVDESGKCLESAQDLLEIVDEYLSIVDRGAPLLDRTGKLKLPCRVCGEGYYQPAASERTVSLQTTDPEGRILSPMRANPFICSVCTHYEFFAPGYPSEAASRGWKPRSS